MKLKHILEFITKQSKLLLMIIGIILVLIIGIADYITGYEFSFSIFYLLPVTFITWFVNKRPGIMTAVTSAVVWFGVDFLSGHIYSNPVIPFWNAGVRFGFFLIVCLILSNLKTAFEQKKLLSITDSLTGIANGRAFYDLALREIYRARRYKRQLTVAYIDVDDFKFVNDNFGHSTGDKLLYLIAETIKSTIRETDIIARLGGDEFAVLLPEADDKYAHIIFEKLRNRVLDAMQENRWPVTLSIGVVTFISPPDSVDDMVNKADALMYSAKENGKNLIKYEVLGGSI